MVRGLMAPTLLPGCLALPLRGVLATGLLFCPPLLLYDWHVAVLAVSAPRWIRHGWYSSLAQTSGILWPTNGPTVQFFQLLDFRTTHYCFLTKRWRRGTCLAYVGGGQSAAVGPWVYPRGRRALASGTHGFYVLRMLCSHLIEW